MYSLQLHCSPEESEPISAELWDWRAIAISESEEEKHITLIAGFESDASRDVLMERYAEFQPVWKESMIDWEEETKRSWPPRYVGARLVVTAPWHELKDHERIQIVLNPGMASGTGEHPCTRLALEALEINLRPEMSVVDVGTGSGILAIAAMQLGARSVTGIEPEIESIRVAKENAARNPRVPFLVAGHIEAIRSSFADITVANISGSVLLSIWDDLLRITRREGKLILTGFEDAEAGRFLSLLPNATVAHLEGWACVYGRLERHP